MAATSTASARAVTRSAAQFLPSRNVVKGHKGRASLILDMHSKLYPHLYDSNKTHLIEPQKASEAVKKWSGMKKAEKADRPVFYEGRGAWKKVYSDEKMEKAIKHTSKLQIYPTKPPIHKTCPDPVTLVSNTQIAQLDPTGARTRLFARTNPECARVGDILLVRQRTGEPFAGVCINIRRRGVDTAIMLRGQLTRIGVEMWFKVYSPLVEGIEVVQRAAKRARRARLTYMRKPKHDRGSVESVVRIYMRQKAALGTAAGKKKGLGALGGGGAAKKGTKRGKKR